MECQSNNPDIIPDQNLTYVYDRAGNRIKTIQNGLTTTYQSNNLDQYTTVGSAIYNYNANGNLLSKVEGNDTWSYTYDNQNRLISVIEPDGSQTKYEYDALGYRIATTYNNERTDYLIDPFRGGNIVGEYDTSGNLISEYAYGLGLVSRTDANDIKAYYDHNGIGSTVSLTGEKGEILNSYEYLPFGKNLFEAEKIFNPFEYIGQWGVMEEINGLNFMRARYYSSAEARFLSPDPLRLDAKTFIESGDGNLYRYVENNPVQRIDPSGLIGLGVEVGLLYINAPALEQFQVFSTVGAKIGLIQGLFPIPTPYFAIDFYIFGKVRGVVVGPGDGSGANPNDNAIGLAYAAPGVGGWFTFANSGIELESADRNIAVVVPTVAGVASFPPLTVSVATGAIPLTLIAAAEYGAGLERRGLEESNFNNFQTLLPLLT